MKKRLLLFVATYLLFLALFVIEKPLFMARYKALFATATAEDWGSVMLHGLPLDLSLAGYLTVIPALMLIATCWTNHKWPRLAMHVYFALVSLLIAAVCIVDLGLYEFWGFRLDATPLFYFFSSPKDAFASVSPSFILLGTLAFLLMSVLQYLLLAVLLLRWKLPRPTSPAGKRTSIKATLVLVVLTALLFIPIRGGVTVSTMNVGKVYFSNDMRLNHAAINPLFSLMESLSKQKDFGSQYRFLEAAKATEIFRTLQDPEALKYVQDKRDKPQSADACLPTTKNDTANAVSEVLTTTRPNVVIIIMESFSSHLMGSLGGRNDVAVNLDRIAKDGLLFTNFYANSFRTDRGLVSILSGYPAQPTTSIMKYPHKSQSLPSICGALKREGYSTHYYYGGDADFTNMRSYLKASGYETILSDKDFPVGDRLSKWGVHDHLVFRRALKEIEDYRSIEPTLRVIQTSSSHEPFDVPYHRLQNERLNAFAYTDSCIGRFVDQLQRLPEWEKTLVVLVPDHLGCYPEHIDNLAVERFKIPLILTGGALRKKGRTDTYGSQIDIAATLLAAMQLPHGAFQFSKDLFCADAPHFAFFTMPDAFGMATEENTLIYNNESGQVVVNSGQKPSLNLQRGQAFLQKLYDDIAKR